ncbi:four helix bundle protein [Oceaniferula marina]|nr:four helix bundle protein [Oceaniferula marina]
MMKTFEDCLVWQKARLLNTAVYRVSKGDAFSQDWALVNQIRRAAGSAMHNVAEGFDAGSDAEFKRFLRYSFRSAGEVQSQLYAALDLEYIDQIQFDEIYSLAIEVKSTSAGLIKYLHSPQ